MNPKPKILIVDDEPRMCDSLSGLLAAEQDYEIHTATSGQDALKILSENKFDLALLDIMMPEMDGHQLMDHIKAMNPETYVIFLTGHASLDSAVKALRKGAYDYLKKPFEYEELLKTVQNALNQKRLKREKENINVELEISKERYRYLVQNSPDIIYTLDAQGNFTFVSDAVERLLGCISGELIGQYYSSIVYEKDVEKAKWFFNERRTGDRANSGIELRLKVSNDNGQFKSCEVRHLTVDLKSTGMYDMPVEESNKKYLGTHGVARDISDRKELESQLQHAHKMEAVGTLAGGIAHDFNNLLMGIQGYASLMLLNIDSTHPYYQKLQNIEEYVQSGAELTKQLLGFARGGKYDVKPIDLNELVSKASRMFGRTKKEVIFHSKYQEDIWLVDADHGQVEQVLLNIFVNAWHAMPGGGDLHVETRNRNLDVSSVKPFDLQPGRYVELYIADNGMGMDEKTRERIFEPFFTTKEMGRGTGLGLASAYGIIRITVDLLKYTARKAREQLLRFTCPHRITR